ncbi:MAG: DEAD/DEAH box helicase, partial [Nitrosotalea sp.]
MHYCPKCKSKIDVQRTFNQKIHFSCPKCKIEDIIDSKKNLDEAFLEFLIKFDNHEIPTKNESESTLEKEGMLQTEEEINKMIGGAKIAEITKLVLFSKRYYVSHFKIIEEPEPEMGSTVIDSGLDQRIIQALESKGIKKFYKFQEEAIHHIVSGDNVVITAPTASGKTESFVVPIIE